MNIGHYLRGQDRHIGTARILCTKEHTMTTDTVREAPALTAHEIDALIAQANREWGADNKASPTGEIPGAAVRLVRLVEARYEVEKACTASKPSEEARGVPESRQAQPYKWECREVDGEMSIVCGTEAEATERYAEWSADGYECEVVPLYEEAPPWTMAGLAQSVEQWREREALELIAAPMRSDGTWNRDREACRRLAAEALGRGPCAT